jgi:hypothetical protein
VLHGPVKPSQTQSNQLDQGLTRNTTIMSEILMLIMGTGKWFERLKAGFMIFVLSKMGAV